MWGFRKGLGRAVFSWHNCVVEAQFVPCEGGLSDDGVYARDVCIYGPFVASCGAFLAPSPDEMSKLKQYFSLTDETLLG